MQPPDPPVAAAASPRAFLRARTHRQALDWSLVLVSQEIESEPAREESGWGLWVNAADEARSREILRQYRLENRRWLWLRRPGPDGVSWSAWAYVWVVVLTLFHACQWTWPDRVFDPGCMDSARVFAGEVWRLVTAVTLHADAQHLLGNLLFGGLVLGLAMPAQGRGWTLLASLLGGVAGNALGLFLHGPNHRGLGASGMVMAALGLLATAAGPASPHHPARSFWIVRSLIGACLLFILMGLDPGSDMVAHGGGFLTGIVLGLGLRRIPPRWRHGSIPNVLAALASVGLVAAAWAFALRHPR